MPTDPHITAMVQWLVEIGYPYDMSTRPPIPEFLRRPLAEAWWQAEGMTDTLEAYRVVLAEEGGWD